MSTSEQKDNLSSLSDMAPRSVEPEMAAKVQGGGASRGSETLASSVEKKRTDTANAVISKIG
jgi:hypothetical protein